MPNGSCRVYLRALSWDQSYFHYILLPSAKLFKIILALVSTFMFMTHSLMFILHSKNSLDDVKKWLFANKLKLNPTQTEFIIFGPRTVHTKLNKFFPVNIHDNLLSPAEAVRNFCVWFDSDIPYFAMLKIPVRLFFISRILSDSEGISRMMLLFLLLWLKDLLTTVIPCLEVSLLFIFIYLFGVILCAEETSTYSWS